MIEQENINNGLLIDKNGNKKWYKDKELHRDNDLPAVEWSDGSKNWYQYGKLHRNDDLPAIESSYGDKEWYQYGVLHRGNDSPAIENMSRREWWINGKLHRDNDLPAVIRTNGTEEYWEHGEQISKEEILHRKEMKKLNETLTSTLPESTIKSPLKKI